MSRVMVEAKLVFTSDSLTKKEMDDFIGVLWEDFQKMECVADTQAVDVTIEEAVEVS